VIRGRFLDIGGAVDRIAAAMRDVERFGAKPEG